ncbi:hypothetical protein [Saccharopolyspora flava]|uniref:Uncharacterized protein n=1 Tax=Saccharopolyspora flava TaxID=95161 RepID=A0A1I6NRG4_9PSEU|nr:hypothetical protein [Saccharopolyspora flava]SFS30528.1 hypothetical protein SAMN05660874_00010 [Saccharopolyspora flava]
MRATNTTPRRKITCGELTAGDLWIGPRPTNETRAITAVTPGPAGTITITCDDDTTHTHPTDHEITIAMTGEE